MSKPRGAVLVEMAWLLFAILVPVITGHQEMIQAYRKQLKALQSERENYDGLRAAKMQR